MTRPQFSLKSLLWSMAVVAAFCAGNALRDPSYPIYQEEVVNNGDGEVRTAYMLMPDGSQWKRVEGKRLPASQAPRSETQE